MIKFKFLQNLPLLAMSGLAVAILLAPSASAAETTYSVKCASTSDGKYKITTKVDEAENNFITPSTCADLGLTKDKWKTLSKSAYETMLGNVIHDTGGAGAAIPETADSGLCPQHAFLAFPHWYRGLQCKTEIGLDGNPSTHVVVGQGGNDIPKTVWTVILNCLDILIQTAGILAVIFLMYNGFQYLTSGGSSDKISKAKTGMLQSMVGLFIAVSAAALIGFIVGRIN
jgi:hypothetical protein